jgi:hypothetical protein
MSDGLASSGALPPAAFDITGCRKAVDAASTSPKAIRAGLVAFAVATVAVVTTLIFMAGDTSVDSGDIAAFVAVGIAAVGVLLAVLVILPLQLVTRERRRRLVHASAAVDSTAEALTAHLASIGYTVPLDVVLDWLASPDSTRTVPLVHDSVIAARWWQPAPDDDRVFVEPYLRVGDTASALPVR